MENKLKHLSRFCCRPSNELEFESVKMAAEIGGFGLDDFEWPDHSDKFTYAWFDEDIEAVGWGFMDEEIEISVLDFCNKLRMTEEEAEKLEDDRVYFSLKKGNFEYIDDGKGMKALNGHYFKTNEDGTEATLHKK